MANFWAQYPVQGSGGGGGGGTVTSVALTTPAILTVSGSPITSAGTITLGLTAEPANEVFAGPTSGGSGTPTFRALVAGDIPSLPYGTGTVTSVNVSGGTTGLTTSGGPVTTSGTITLSGTLGVSNGGTGTTTSTGSGSVVLNNSPTLITPVLGTPSSGTLTNVTGLPLTSGVTGILPVPNGGTGASTLTLDGVLYGNGTSAVGITAAGTTGQVLTATTGSAPAWASPATSGTVTSVGLSSPGVVYTVSGSPVTSSGTLTLNLISQTANTVLAGPTSGGSATPTFRALVSADIPSLSATYVTQSEVGVASGVASLDGSGKIPVAQLPSAVFIYQGTWNPNTNTPTLADGTGVTGYTYWVSAAFAGPVSGLNNASMVNFQIGDLVLYNGSQWELTTPAAGVRSVNSAQGVVSLTASSSLSGTTLAFTGTSLALTGTLGITNGGTGQTTASAAFNALNPMTTTGDLIYESATGVAGRLGVGTTGQVLTVSGGVPTWATPTAGGTVTSVSVVSANGLAGTVATSTTTPAITLSTTVTGILSGNGTAISAASTTGSGNVVLATSPTLTTPSLDTPTLITLTNATGLPLTTGVTGILPIANGGTAVSSVTTAPTATAWAGWDSNKNLSANDFIAGYTATAVSASTVTLTVASAQQQYFTGSGSNQTVVMPAVSTLVLGQTYLIVNNSLNAVTVQSSGANTIVGLGSGQQATLTVILTTGTTASSWYAEPGAKVLPVGFGGTGLSSVTSNGIVYGTGSGGGSGIIGVTAAGTTGQVLTATTSSAPTWKTGLTGQTSGSAIAAGVVGEYIENNTTSAVTITAGTTRDIDSGGASPVGIILSAGVWDITASVQFITGAATATTVVENWIGTVSGNSATGQDIQRNYTQSNQTFAVSETFAFPLPIYRVNISSSTTYYLKVAIASTGTSPTATGNIRATRVA